MFSREHEVLALQQRPVDQVRADLLSALSLVTYRNERVVTFTDQQEIPFTNWTDETEWPLLDDLAGQVKRFSWESD